MTEAVINFGPIKSARLFEAICGQIRSQMASGQIRPGDKLPPERDLAEQFAVSRSAVREALRALENSGLIELRKGQKGGAFILEESAPFTQSYENMLELGRIPLADFAEARILITEVVVRLACERATERDFAALEVDIERLAKAVENDEARKDTHYITDFYDILAAATGNQMLRYITHGIAELLSRLITATKPDSPYDLAKQRREVLAALRARNAKKASALLSKHFTRIHEQLVEAQARDAKWQTQRHEPANAKT